MDTLDFLFFSKRKKGQYIPSHNHNCCELVYYFASGKTEIDSTEYTFYENNFALISPNTNHDEIHFVDADVLYIGFYTENEIILEKNGVFQDSRDWVIRECLVKMREEFVQEQSGFSKMLHLLVGKLVIHLQRLIGKTKKYMDHTDDRMQYVRNYMEEYFQQKLTNEILANIAGYSYDHFRHLFKEKFSMTPQRYLYLKRMEFAKACLIHDPSKLISDIALEAGFSNDSQFCSMFKRETGMTPKMYREEQNKV
ncbi:helix-turn-helix domain-containing protein [Virgibacillus dokdonensis]|uniref:helix-turn-helix domain-containing protein n=1 Tax=Virgibacillus dokdonensis TaxID=302167 RepID=UPI00098B3DB3|nr:AraC family transcriptional regulator [Virgibacillus dokdonensis]